MRAAILALAVGASVLAACSSDGASSGTSSGDAAAARGLDVVHSAGCETCHGVGGRTGGTGPAWGGLAGSTVTLEDGTTVRAGDEYLHRSITDPQADIVDGYPAIMPTFDLPDDKVDAIVAYIESLR